MKINLPWLTILKILSAAALIWAWLRIWPIVLVLLVALVIAVTLEPAICWLERRGIKRGVGVLLVGAITLTVVGLFVAASVTPLTLQAKLLAGHIAAFQEAIAESLPIAVARVVRRGAQDPTEMVAAITANAPAAIGGLLTAAATTLFAFVLTLYLLADGRRAYEWVMAYVPRAHRANADQTVTEVTTAVFAFVVGNVLTSLFAAGFVFVSLTLLHVPGAFMLAIVAGVCDFIPILGFFVVLAPAVLLALSVSPAGAAGVVGAYVLCHAIENYAIAPKLYGHQLQLSGVAVLLALVVGAALAGIVGALLALPAIAAYPIVERRWLREHLGSKVLAEHARLQDEGQT